MQWDSLFISCYKVASYLDTLHQRSILLVKPLIASRCFKRSCRGPGAFETLVTGRFRPNEGIHRALSASSKAASSLTKDTRRGRWRVFIYLATFATLGGFKWYWHTIDCDYETWKHSQIIKDAKHPSRSLISAFFLPQLQPCSARLIGSSAFFFFGGDLFGETAKQYTEFSTLARESSPTTSWVMPGVISEPLSILEFEHGGDCGHKTAASVAWYPSLSTHHHFRYLCRAGAAPSAAAGAGAGATASAAAGAASAAGAPEAWGGFALASREKVAALQGRSQFDIG